MSAPLSLSVIIPCRNEARHIEGCLRSVLAQESVDGGFEVLVADGMSDDGTRKILARLIEADSRLRVVDNPGRIVSTGLNAAIRAARGKIIVRMDAHTEYAPDYLYQCMVVLNQRNADNVGGPWLARGKGWVSRAVAAAFQSPFSAGGAQGHNACHEGVVDTVYLGCWPRAVFDRIGYFDEELVRNQDDELNLRLTRAGGKIWQSPRIKSWYTPRGSLTALFRQYFQYGYWKVRVIQKHKLPASPRHLVPGLFVLGLGPGWLAGFIHWSLWLVYGGAVACYAAMSLVFSVRAATGRREAEPQRDSATERQNDRAAEVRDQRSNGPRASSPATTTDVLNGEREPESRNVQHSEFRIQHSTFSASGGRDARAPGRNWDLLPILPIVFLTYHLAYGTGFLLGIWDFIIRRKGGRAGMTKLTR